MTADIISALKKISSAQMKFVLRFSSTLGQNVANELSAGYEDLLKALDAEPACPPSDRWAQAGVPDHVTVPKKP